MAWVLLGHYQFLPGHSQKPNLMPHVGENVSSSDKNIQHLCTGKKYSGELTCSRKVLRCHPLCDYRKALAPMTRLVPLEGNFVNCHSKTIWQLEMRLLKIIRPTTSLHAGVKWQIQTPKVGQKKLSHLPIDDLTLAYKKK